MGRLWERRSAELEVYENEEVHTTVLYESETIESVWCGRSSSPSTSLSSTPLQPPVVVFSADSVPPAVGNS